MNGRNRSRRTSRQTTGTRQQSVGFRQGITRHDRQRTQAPYKHRFYLPPDVHHRYNVACLSTGGCF